MRIFRNIFVYLIIFSCAYLFITRGVQAASLKFDKDTVSVSPNATFTLGAIVDAGSDQITSVDMWILYDANLLEAQSASAGAFFPAVTNNISAGKIYIAGLITDPGSYKTGTGTVATITFKGLANGRATVTYDCRTDVSNSSKVIKNTVESTNVIECAQSGTSIVTIGTGGTAPTIAPTTVYQQQPVPTALPQSGFMDELPKLMVFGSLFLIVGVAMRVLLIL